MVTPRLDKLFHVLVVLGAASCAEDDTESRDRQLDAPAAATDGAAASSDGAAASSDGGELVSCFCETDACCDRSSGTAVLQDGFVCCWAACT